MQVAIQVTVFFIIFVDLRILVFKLCNLFDQVLVVQKQKLGYLAQADSLICHSYFQVN